MLSRLTCHVTRWTLVWSSREKLGPEKHMQCMGPQPSKPGGPLVRTEQSKDRTLEKKTHLSGWKGKQAQEMGDVRVKEAGGKKANRVILEG